MNVFGEEIFETLLQFQKNKHATMAWEINCLIAIFFSIMVKWKLCFPAANYTSIYGHCTETAFSSIAASDSRR